MRLLAFLSIFLITVITISPAFAQSNMYNLQVDEHNFDISYSVDADVLAMEIDQQTTSLLIGLENTQTSNFSITVPNEVLSSEDYSFSVLVDWVEVDYNLLIESDAITFDFFVPEDTLEIEIIGTHVIPEFPFGVMIIFAVVMIATITMSKKFDFFRS